ncbi:hypothetical protein OF829_04305 [Sphingomonas sp. LB-2]|uniref:hypothetical protein n=1 Tax=Sphingomonas caeni TaxID=2984949 RepID=UPI00222E7EB4|nr:hypothetical protein [Sphingomonas caeni]MCW3846450.1 hypothetical protein [Sphingomonas caeni]
MRNRLLAAVAALVIATPALADDWDFVLINNTVKEINLVMVAPTGTQTWQKNIVDEDAKRVTRPGARMTVHFDKGAGCKYDLKATFADDTSLVWTGVNVCDNSYVTVKISASGTPTFSAN